VTVVATDLDHTLIWEDNALRPRTLRALARAREEGLRVIVVTGRMVQSMRRVMAPAGLRDPVICYQGAVVADRDGRWLRHEPIELELAREAIAAVEAEGYSPNLYVDDELYVSETTPQAEAYAGFQQLAIHAVGDLRAWLETDPTKVVCVGDPAALDALGERMRERFAGRLYVTKSLPFFLELATIGVTKGSGLAFLAEQEGFTPDQTVAFGDGENDVELLEWAGYAVAVGNAHERVKAVADWVCPPAAEEGVAAVLEALLDRRVGEIVAEHRSAKPS
jgi:Cof subfamily protein (haloacid dehalogenase superfamily)